MKRYIEIDGVRVEFESRYCCPLSNANSSCLHPKTILANKGKEIIPLCCDLFPDGCPARPVEENSDGK